MVLSPKIIFNFNYFNQKYVFISAIVKNKKIGHEKKSINKYIHVKILKNE